MLAMVKNLEAALADRIDAAQWMGTRRARRRTPSWRAFTEKIGYPTRGATTPR